MSVRTIYAPSTGGGLAGIAVIRISGPEAGPALQRLTGAVPPPPRHATLSGFHDPDSGEELDRGLVIWFPSPASFTGEDMAEFHVHGGRAVVDGILAALGRCPGLRPAEAGDFTRRAFTNGKLDLTAAEGLADLINAETAAQRKQALRQMQGELGRLYDSWNARLLAALAHMEAAIDFSDEDLPAGILGRVGEEAAVLDGEIAAHLEDGRRGERLRDGLHIAIIGAPNAGKSSLLNLLARRDAAIVAETAGTTRDVIEVHLDLGGYPVVVADTAGLRDGGDAVESEGVRRARARAGDAELKLAVFDGAAWPARDAETERLVDRDTVVVVNKSDLGLPAAPLEVNDRAAVPVSALTGDGIDGLLRTLETELAARAPAGAAPSLTRARHRQALEECRAALARLGGAGQVELAAEDLRLAVRSLGRITGRVEVDDILDVIFHDFCIGK